MNLQVLVSTMDQTDHSLVERMNIKSNAIIINQCNQNKCEEFVFGGNRIKFLSFMERGVGLSRNNALMRSDSDISVFADDDVTYVDGYKDIIIQAFINNPKADVIVFNVPSTNPARPTNSISKVGRVKLYNCLRYGAVNIAVRTESIKRTNIYFSLLFGGGARYSAGEDSLFIADCIRKGLKIYTNPGIIGFVKQEESSWFEGFTDKYFIDKGAFFRSLSERWAKLLCLQFALRHSNLYRKEKTIRQSYRLMIQGVNSLK